jgi:hypothetical protein
MRNDTKQRVLARMDRESEVLAGEHRLYRDAVAAYAELLAGLEDNEAIARVSKQLAGHRDSLRHIEERQDEVRLIRECLSS